MTYNEFLNKDDSFRELWIKEMLKIHNILRSHPITTKELELLAEFCAVSGMNYNGLKSKLRGLYPIVSKLHSNWECSEEELISDMDETLRFILWWRQRYTEYSK